MQFVTEVVDGHTFEIEKRWSFHGKRGCRIRIHGYDPPSLDGPAGELARNNLLMLILGSQVELRAFHGVVDGSLVCDVYFHGRPLAEACAAFVRSR